MTEDGDSDDVSCEVLLERIEALTDLFKRRLLDDRAKQVAIEDLQARLTRAENAASATALKPIVDALALIVERLRGAEPIESLVNSAANELEYVLEAVVGASTISARPGDAINGLRHEVASVSGEGTELQVAELIRVGYEKHGVVLRPAVVAACWLPAGAAQESGGGE